jgi:hypothetical protein
MIKKGAKRRALGPAVHAVLFRHDTALRIANAYTCRIVDFKGFPRLFLQPDRPGKPAVTTITAAPQK